MQTRKLKISPLTRAMSAGDIAASGDKGDVFEFPFSSELPVDRWFGTEVLSHDPGAPDFSRLNDGAPLLWNHNRDVQIGVIEGARLGSDRRAYCQVRMGSSEQAQEICADVAAGIIRNVSVGYMINRMTEEQEGGKSTFTATRWTPYEVSFVSIPADQTVGIGRSPNTEEFREIDIEIRGATTANEEPPMTPAAPVPAAPAVDTAAIAAQARAEAITFERDRIGSIEALGRKFEKPDLARQLIEGGRTIEAARAAFLEELGARQVPVAAAPASGIVDMTDKEQNSYSVVRAINAAINKDWKGAGFELEVSRALAKELGRETEGFFLPHNLRMAPMQGERTTYNVGTAGQGGNLVATQLLASSFIEVLRNKALLLQMGPTLLAGLVGNIAIPRQITGTQTYWVTEGTAITQAEATFDQVTLSPKQLGARSQYSRLMLQQATPDIEAVVRSDLAAVMALGLDSGAISGSGSSGQPRGILNTSGIGTVAMGTNGAAFTASSTTAGTGFDQIVDLEAKVDIANASGGAMAYLTNAKVKNNLKKIKDQQGLPLWFNSTNNVAMGASAPGSLNGYGAMVSNQVPFNLTKGTSNGICSALIFGDFSQLLIGMWGGLEILPNPYGAGYNAGAVDIRAMQTMDVAVRHAESFAAITDILTTF